MKRLATITILLLIVALCAPAQARRTEYPQVITFTIANGETVSDAKDLAGCTPAALYMPAAFTGTALTFQVSDGTAYLALYDEYGTPKSITVAASRAILLSPADFWSAQKMKLVSGSAEAAARTIKLICRH